MDQSQHNISFLKILGSKKWEKISTHEKDEKMTKDARTGPDNIKDPPLNFVKNL